MFVARLFSHYPNRGKGGDPKPRPARAACRAVGS
jgi:hypothetical protein